MTGFAQDDTGVDVELSDGQSLRADCLAGCDGGRSVIRKAAGIEFPGWDPSTSWLIAEVEMDEEPQLGVRREGGGIGRAGDGRRLRIVLTERHLEHTSEPVGFDITPWAGRVRLVDAVHVGAWELPVLGEVTAPTAVLIRPDGYVAWVGDLTDPGLLDALTTWFGPPTPA